METNAKPHAINVVTIAVPIATEDMPPVMADMISAPIPMLGSKATNRKRYCIEKLFICCSV
jgi:hypothetical protein